MKNLISSTTIWIAIALVALMSVGTAYAETKLVRVEIPFKFFAADKVLPAGAGRSSGYELPKSKAEREMARAASGGTQIAWVRILTK